MLQNLVLPKNTADILLSILRNFDQINEVFLFGSRAKGTNHERSDIDLAIKNSEIDRHYLGDLKMELDESDIPYKIDIQIFESIKNKDLRNHILRVGKLIYKKKISE